MFVFLLIAGAVQADFISWDGSSSDDWMVADNWQGNNIPDADDTARVWTDSPNATVLHSGDSLTLQQLWVAHAGGAGATGNLTIQAGADIAVSGVIDVNNAGVLTCNGELNANDYFRTWSNAVVHLHDDPAVAIDVVVAPGKAIQVNDYSTFNLGADVAVSAPSIWFNNSSTCAFASASAFTGDVWVRNSANASISGVATGTVTMQDFATATLDGDITGNVRVWDDSGVVIEGTVTGNLEIGSTNGLNRIGETGFILGNCQLSTGDTLVIAGTVTNGVFGCNQTGEAVIESTARIYSTGNDCWLYNTAKVTWMAGATGAVGTIWADRTGNGSYTDEVRYTGSADLNVDFTAYDSGTHGSTLEVKLVSDTQNDFTGGNGFGSNVAFWNSGVEHTDITYLGNGAFRINNIPASPAANQGTVFLIR